MSALRRDLIERKLWMLIAPLVLAVVAVPLLLLSGGSAGGASATPAPPPAATPVSAAVSTSTKPSGKKAPVKTAYVTPKRNPFAGSGKTSTTTTTSASTTSTTAASSASPATTAGSSGSATTAAATAMVTPSPASSGQSSTASTPTSSPTSNAGSTPVSTTASATSAPQATTAAVQSWTVYSVSVRYGKDTSVPLRANVARLTTFPSAHSPEAMFLGVMKGGKQAVFALGTGLGHTGPGLCRPAHSRCSAILLQAGQTEHITVPVTGGTVKHVILRVVRITQQVTHSHKVALAAYQRYSAAGLCDLALADPVLYDLGTGTVSGMPKAVCQHQSKSVPFTPLIATP